MTRTAFVIAGLGYGDCGKGATVDFLCRTRDVGLVVRYNGGSQAAHNVVTPEGKHHTFAQFGSGTFVPGVRTHLSQYMLVDPSTMMCEEEHLRALGITDAFERTTVDERCLIITPFQKAVNQIEQKCSNLKTSCGMGVGQTRSDHIQHGNKVMFARDFRNAEKAKEKLRFIQKISAQAVERYGIIARKLHRAHFDFLSDPSSVDRYWKDMLEWPVKIILESGLDSETRDIVFEGAQGVLLDEHYGEYGFNTWTDTTFRNAAKLLEESKWSGEVKKIGVVRTYLTRHGAGLFKTESSAFDHLQELHNCDQGFQGKFRRGFFDTKLILRAIEICGGVDCIALNHIDTNQKFFTRDNKKIEALVKIRGFGPTAEDREYDATFE